MDLHAQPSACRQLRTRPKPSAIIAIYSAHCRSAQPHRLLKHCIEYGREIAWRGVYHLQHLGNRCLPLQCLALFRQQPRVLDSGDRLIGEGADKFDLPIDERLDPAPP